MAIETLATSGPREDASVPPMDGDALTYRIERLESDIRDLRNNAEGWHASLGSSATTLQSQLAALQVTMPETYVPRREINEKFDNSTKRRNEEHEQLRADIKELREQNQWMLRAVITSGFATALAFLQTIFHFIPTAAGH